MQKFGDVVQGSLRRDMIKGTNIETGTLHLKHARAFAIEGFLTQRYDGWSVCEQYLHSVLLLSANIRTIVARKAT
jgi:hypothetical protein